MEQTQQNKHKIIGCLLLDKECLELLLNNLPPYWESPKVKLIEDAIKTELEIMGFVNKND